MAYHYNYFMNLLRGIHLTERVKKSHQCRGCGASGYAHEICEYCGGYNGAPNIFEPSGVKHCSEKLPPIIITSVNSF